MSLSVALTEGQRTFQVSLETVATSLLQDSHHLILRSDPVCNHNLLKLLVISLPGLENPTCHFMKGPAPLDIPGMDASTSTE
jgi:hypothetical protein